MAIFTKEGKEKIVYRFKWFGIGMWIIYCQSLAIHFEGKWLWWLFTMLWIYPLSQVVEGYLKNKEKT